MDSIALKHQIQSLIFHLDPIANGSHRQSTSQPRTHMFLHNIAKKLHDGLFSKKGEAVNSFW